MERLIFALSLLVGYGLFTGRIIYCLRFEKRSWPRGRTGIILALAFAFLVASLPLAILIAIGKQTTAPFFPMMFPIFR